MTENQRKSVRELYATDSELKESGVWVDLNGQMSVKIRATGNKKHQELLNKLKKPYAYQFRKGSVDPDIELKINLKAMCRTILVDWKGFIDEEGKEMTFSPDTALALLSDKDYEELAGDILLAATLRETFTKEEVWKESEKNLKTSSSGISNTAS